ncbi:MAG: hypothetical protein ACLRFR_01685 [Clostridia bacterium]
MSVKNPKAKKQNRFRYAVCLDTNIVVSLAALRYGNEMELRTLKLNKKYESIKQLSDAIKKRQIIAIITPTVVAEIAEAAQFFDYGTLEFLQRSNIQVLQIPEEKQDSHNKAIKKIAAAYSTTINKFTLADIAEANGGNVATYAHRVFSSKKNRETGKIVLQPDALIMAESAYLGLVLVTNNTLDFIYGHRPELISKINRGLNLSPRALPHTSPRIMEMYHNGLPFPHITKDDIILTPAEKFDFGVQHPIIPAKNQANFDADLENPLEY